MKDLLSGARLTYEQCSVCSAPWMENPACDNCRSITALRKLERQKAAKALGQARWAKKLPEERSAHGKMMAERKAAKEQKR